MRMSALFGQTLRTAPSDADVASHQLLIRAGFIRQLAAGIFSYLPLAQRSLTKIENIMREEINALGGQEITMPVIHPADVWKESGRYYLIGAEMGRFSDRAGRALVLAMTHEEIVTDLVRKEIHSYRQLPALIYHIQTKWRDDPRPRAGLLRVREFTMLDSYSLDATEAGLDAHYRAHYQAYFNIFNRCGLPTLAVAADVGMMGGSLSHEFMYLTSVGEDTLVICDTCGYCANRQVAICRNPEAAPETAQAMQKAATPHCSTIDELAAFLNVPKARTAKAVFLVATVVEGEADVEKFVFAVVRGDMEVNETKLANALRAKDLRPAREDEIVATGAVPGYAAPIGVHGAIIVVDESIARSPNLVAGANETGYHLLDVNYGRDYSADIVTDIAVAQEGAACANCGNALRTARGVEVGNIFKLGTRYSEALGATFLDADGKEKPVIMGSYGIGSGRLLACIAEEHHDSRGLIWPVSVAPYHLHLIKLSADSSVADSLYTQLQAVGVEVLYDDRVGSAGVKFNDADLIGLPLRLTVGDKSLAQGGVELKRRDSSESRLVPVAEAVSAVEAELRALTADIARRVITVPYTG